MISVIIVIWNGKEYVLKCLETLFLHCGHLPLEVIAVDNASTDGSADEVQRRFPKVRLIRNEHNLGFAKANNLGIQESKGEFLCLVNSDVEFIHDCLTPLAAFLESSPTAGILGPQMLNSESKVARSTMKFPTVWTTFIRNIAADLFFSKSTLFQGQLNLGFDHLETRDVEVLNGWFWFIRRSAVAKVGLLDEDFFMYGEDLDWCARFVRAGQRVVFFSEAKALHHGGASSASSPVFFSIEQERATLQLIRKHRGPVVAGEFLLCEIFGNLARSIWYGLSWLLRPASRRQSFLKYRRSTACLWWLTFGTR